MENAGTSSKLALTLLKCDAVILESSVGGWNLAPKYKPRRIPHIAHVYASNLIDAEWYIRFKLTHL